jgi:hemerythrin superfamily protein
VIYSKNKSVGKKKLIVSEICKELSVHAQVEEEIFYPAFKQASKDKVLVPEAKVEHATVKDLIAQVEGKASNLIFKTRKKEDVLGFATI